MFRSNPIQKMFNEFNLYRGGPPLNKLPETTGEGPSKLESVKESHEELPSYIKQNLSAQTNDSVPDEYDVKELERLGFFDADEFEENNSKARPG